MGRTAAVSHRAPTAAPRLRAVKSVRKKAGSRRAPGSSARYDHHCRDLFNLVCVLMLGVTVFALARVTLAASAAEVAIDSGELNCAIKAERLVGDLLECDKSALTTPSRIESIAGESLQMAQAPQVSYLRLVSDSAATSSTVAVSSPDTGSAGVVAPSPAPEGAVAVASVTPTRSAFSGILASVMEMAAGEAEVLLVGDAGLASTR